MRTAAPVQSIDWRAFGLSEQAQTEASPLAILRGERTASPQASEPQAGDWLHAFKGLVANTAASEGMDWMTSGKEWPTGWLAVDLSSDTAMTRADGFQVVVTDMQDARLAVLRGQTDQMVLAGETSTIEVAPDAFAHVSTDAKVILSLSMLNGQALPTWIQLNPLTGRISVTPPALTPSSARELVLRLGAQDEAGEQAMTVFRLTIRENVAGPSGRSSFSDKLQRASGLLASVAPMNFQTLLRHG